MYMRGRGIHTSKAEPRNTHIRGLFYTMTLPPEYHALQRGLAPTSGYASELEELDSWPNSPSLSFSGTSPSALQQ